jgi:hypothetical protein
LTFWHGYYDQNQYLPLVITCADNDQFVMLSLLPNNAHAALGANDDLAYLVGLPAPGLAPSRQSRSEQHGRRAAAPAAVCA